LGSVPLFPASISRRLIFAFKLGSVPLFPAFHLKIGENAHARANPFFCRLVKRPCFFSISRCKR
jgi:hypothetical protein